MQGDGSLNGGFQQGDLNSILLQTTSNNDCNASCVNVKARVDSRFKICPELAWFLQVPKLTP